MRWCKYMVVCSSVNRVHWSIYMAKMSRCLVADALWQCALASRCRLLMREQTIWHITHHTTNTTTFCIDTNSTNQKQIETPHCVYPLRVTRVFRYSDQMRRLGCRNVDDDDDDECLVRAWCLRMGSGLCVYQLCSESHSIWLTMCMLGRYKWEVNSREHPINYTALEQKSKQLYLPLWLVHYYWSIVWEWYLVISTLMECRRIVFIRNTLKEEHPILMERLTDCM